MRTFSYEASALVARVMPPLSFTADRLKAARGTQAIVLSTRWLVALDQIHRFSREFIKLNGLLIVLFPRDNLAT